MGKIHKDFNKKGMLMKIGKMKTNWLADWADWAAIQVE